MITQPGSSIVRILNQGNATVGAGFLVAEKHVLTCAHVVSQALGLSHDEQSPLKSEVRVNFPLVAPEHDFAARIVRWQPESDVAGLELGDTPPVAARPARLVKAQDLWHHNFRAFGFPTGYDDGVWAVGVLRGQQAAGWIQIEDVKEPGYWVQPGFSGTPVWDEQLNGVVGMTVAADTSHQVKAAFMIPTDLLVKAWPLLAETIVDVTEPRPPQVTPSSHPASVTFYQPGQTFTQQVNVAGDYVDQRTSTSDQSARAPRMTEISDQNTAVIRELVTAAFTDEKLTAICFDHFRSVYEDFSSDMGKGRKVQRLLDHCARHDKLEILLRLIGEHNPAQYARFEPRLLLD